MQTSEYHARFVIAKIHSESLIEKYDGSGSTGFLKILRILRQSIKKAISVLTYTPDADVSIV